MKKFLPYLIIILGSAIYAIGLNAFIVGNGLAEGGFVGLSLVLYYKLHILIGVSFFVLNIPVLIFGWRFFGKFFILKTILGVVGVSLFSILTAHFTQNVHDKLLAGLYGGVICGTGLGLIFRSGGTTGGVDIVARIIHHYFGFAIGKIMFASDVIVIALVTLVLGKEVAMYSLVALFVSSRLIDFVIDGFTSSRATMIISEHAEAISQRIHEELGRGTTYLHGSGGFTNSEKKVIYCVVNRNEIARLQSLVHEIDPIAFLVSQDVHDVLGEGFTF